MKTLNCTKDGSGRTIASSESKVVRSLTTEGDNISIQKSFVFFLYRIGEYVSS